MVEPLKHDTKSIGSLGERLAAHFLAGKGYQILQSNYLRSWGEIDLIVQKNNRISFVEVKTVSYETKAMLIYAVTHETWRPEEQVHRFKLHQIEKALETWISEHNYVGDWDIDVIAVRIVPRETYASVLHLQNIVVG